MGYTGTYDTSLATIAVAALSETSFAFVSPTRVFKYDMEAQELTLLAGTGAVATEPPTNGAGNVATFTSIVDLAVDYATGALYIADAGNIGSSINSRIRQVVENADGTTTVSTVRTFGLARQVVAVATSGHGGTLSPNRIYALMREAVYGTVGRQVEKISYSSGSWTGSDTGFTVPRLAAGTIYPTDIAVDNSERIFIMFGVTPSHGDVMDRSYIYRYSSAAAATHNLLYLSDYNETDFDLGSMFSAKAIACDHQDNLYIAYTAYDYDGVTSYDGASFITKLDMSTLEEELVAGSTNGLTKVDGNALSEASFLNIRDIGVQRDGFFRTPPASYPNANRLFIIDGQDAQNQIPYLRQYYLSGATGG